MRLRPEELPMHAIPRKSPRRSATPTQVAAAPAPVPAPAVAATPAAPEPNPAPPAAAGFLPLDYARDVVERSILFWDTLRQRADDLIAHERAGKPPLLDFDYETLLDARRFERPANYALLRITRIGEDRCEECCTDASKPPVMIVDPRAGHGPGIGGFKRDSEVGMAMREGHPVYFVVFFPEPCPDQTLADVLHALRRFVEVVAERHPGTRPVLYGNCQAGWAIALLSADCQGLAGPAVLNGSPLSYWAGEPGVNPMRIAGGFVGGAWMTHLLADLGDSRFDGAWLVQNFETLKPEAVWEKYACLFVAVDTERDRFLEFERWWGSFYFLGREEILSIVENLFIGNRLEEGGVRICDGCFADLRRIRNPLVIFASHGDNITPPHQALGWIPAVYEDTADLKAAGQRIVYLIDPHVGHLGIFVSAKVARLEHRAILESLAEIESLEPGLYEMRIDNPSGDPDSRKPAYAVRFEPREVEDLKFPATPEAFERVRQVSEANERLYRDWAGPLVRALANPWSAAVLERLHPMRTSRMLLSGEFNPWMGAVRELARQVGQRRKPLPPEHPLMASESDAVRRTGAAIGAWREWRDGQDERMFALLYGAGQPAAAAKPATRKGASHGR
ncbi:putative alpha/beta-Hydrolase [Thiomonas arsenitoxydans]|uniref:Alpha/beta-Hydrolase n=3 Tax=Burkholderiales genera incertae sedis TaxID=224471 RepID=D6CMC8_THIA3|nr:putative alpha/beta-Hydrolase [Thiomonas arsenitoxydans]CDW96201.1 putative alpha/beta-Hydrolase [Thiomonas sp. CB2]CQR45669.1 putative alpha/beta-Hydrolase [Thiomonas sp. CB3]SBP89154.1 putative alpha/beta-Hydrolase [Thiomonas delicata]VDY06845.1 putative alpha/beta-Hydrolase [Thiomonas sp. Bio17B3]VDY09859.1 putative alpha/beta-Hydrolase [Thiomonas sp. Sup16B3]VDY15121.1 putative alpha/beta-Hydrolase [Thiomonas sp. OC7]